MPRISAELRARMCQFTTSDGRRCRLPRAATGEGYCPSHAAQIRKQREEEYIAGLLSEPLAHNTFASTSLSFMLARLFTAVANGHVSPKTSNALLRIIDGLRKTLPNTRNEFLQCYDSQGLSNLVRALHHEHEEFLRVAGAHPGGETPGSTEAEAPHPELVPIPPPRPFSSREEFLQQLAQRLTQ